MRRKEGVKYDDDYVNEDSISVKETEKKQKVDTKIKASNFV